MKSKFSVDENLCVKCGQCEKDCLSGALILKENGCPEMKNPNRCIKCQHCFAVCPVGAISIQGKDPKESDEIREINSDDVLNLIKSRRSIRQFKQINVSQEKIEKLKDMLKYVPTGCNSHKLHFCFIEDIETMNAFRGEVNSYLSKILDKKIFKGLKEKLNKFSKTNNPLGEEDMIFRGAPHLVIACAPIDSPCPNQDGIIALSYFELYANSLGIGTLWCGFLQGVLKLFPQFDEYLQIPKGYNPIYAMLFGESDVKYHRTPQPLDCSFTTVEVTEKESPNWFSRIGRIISNFIR